MDKEEFKRRTKAFAIQIGKFCKTVPHDQIVRYYIDQIVRSSASVGANYRAACRAKSKPDFINKMRIVEEEADETMYFLELIYEFHPDKKEQIVILHKEANELLSMTISSINTSLKTLKSKIANLKYE
ncbi:MAG: four helix bundle protein [Chitinophagaceae bacterium]